MWLLRICDELVYNAAGGVYAILTKWWGNEPLPPRRDGPATSEPTSTPGVTQAPDTTSEPTDVGYELKLELVKSECGVVRVRLTASGPGPGPLLTGGPAFPLGVEPQTVTSQTGSRVNGAQFIQFHTWEITNKSCFDDLKFLLQAKLFDAAGSVIVANAALDVTVPHECCNRQVTVPTIGSDVVTLDAASVQVQFTVHVAADDGGAVTGALVSGLILGPGSDINVLEATVGSDGIALFTQVVREPGEIFFQLSDVTADGLAFAVEDSAFISERLQVAFDAPTATPTEVPAVALTGGTFDVTFSVGSDPAGHDQFIAAMPSELTVTVAGSAITITGGGGFVAVTGTLGDDGSFTASGSGTVAGFANVGVRFDGTLTAGGVGGSYALGTGGELPQGLAIEYAVE